MGFHPFTECPYGEPGCTFCTLVRVSPAPKEPTVMDFAHEAKSSFMVLEQLRDLEPDDFDEMALRYLELMLRRAATQAARGVIVADREFEGEVRKAIEHMEVILASLKLTVETL